MGDVYNWSAVLRTEYNVINDNCGAHRVNSLRVSDGRSRYAEPMGDMGGWLIPTAALLRSLQWVSDGRSRVAEPRGCGGIARPTAALLRSLQWVSDGRSRVAEPRGCEGIARPTAALLRSLQWVSDGRSRVAEPVGRWEIRYVMRELRSVLVGHVYMKPTASCGAAQLWAYAYTPDFVPRRGTNIA